MTMLACPVCAGHGVEQHVLPYPSFRHLDFAPIGPGPVRLGRCAGCGLVFRMSDPADAAAVLARYRDAAYVNATPAPHMIAADGFPGPVPQTVLQAKLLAPVLPSQARILDIGCANGALLRAFADRGGVDDLCGFDVSERPAFPRGAPFRFVAGDLRRVEGMFDLVVLSHALQYVPDLAALFEQIGARLAPGGAVFIQVPDFAQKAAALLFGDLFWHFTPAVLSSVLRRLGFAVESVQTAWFPRDVLVLARPDPAAHATTPPADNAMDDAADALRRMADALARFPAAEQTGVLGTTIDASFAASMLGSRVTFFVDENPEKIGRTFRGLPIIAPRTVSASAAVAVPLGPAGERVSARLAQKNPGQWIAV
jgi:SAM-dependent methyltransferase